MEDFINKMNNLAELYPDRCEIDPDHVNTWIWHPNNEILMRQAYPKVYDDIEIILLNEEEPVVMFHILGTRGSFIVHLNDIASDIDDSAVECSVRNPEHLRMYHLYAEMEFPYFREIFRK